MAFIEVTDMGTHIYEGVQNTISQGDTDKLSSAISAAIAEAQGYLNRYNIEQLFDNVNADAAYTKDAILQMHVKSLAKWHFILLANPSIDYDDAELRYSQALRWLEKVQKGMIVPRAWPPADAFEGADTFFDLSSRPRRNNHY
jgi:phage gp36-like protein